LRFATARDRNQHLVGRTVRALTTEPGKAGTTLARTDAYKQVVLPGILPIGDFVECYITAASAVDGYLLERIDGTPILAFALSGAPAAP